MKTTANLKLLLPEGKDPVNISDITSNFEALDTYLVDMQTAASDASRNTVTFATASDRQNVASTESLSTIVGKIAKWFSDLKAAAFCTVANNETTTAEGVVLDARVGKKHGDQLNGLYFKRDANGKMGYATSETGTVTPFRNPTGDATAAEVLSGKTFSSASLENEKGTMTNNGAWTGSTTGDGNVTIPAGYHNGSGYVSGKTSYNDGYAKGKAKLIGEGGDGSYSAATVDGYKTLTADDFVFVYTGISGASYWGGRWGNDAPGTFDSSIDLSGAPSISYNATNGLVTVSGCTLSNSHNNGYAWVGDAYAKINVTITGKIYCIG